MYVLFQFSFYVGIERPLVGPKYSSLEQCFTTTAFTQWVAVFLWKSNQSNTTHREEDHHPEVKQSNQVDWAVEHGCVFEFHSKEIDTL